MDLLGPTPPQDLPIGINYYVQLKMLEEKRNCIFCQINCISRTLVPKVLMIKNDKSIRNHSCISKEILISSFSSYIYEGKLHR